jgi:1-acyl-sn-glycerol-3-phosphate acyltransferase
MKKLSERWLSFCYRLLYIPVVWLAILAFSARTRGRSNIPKTGPFLVVANHQSAIDPVLIALAAIRPMRFLARRTLFSPPAFGWSISSLGAIPLNHDMSGKEGLKTGLELLKEGNGLLIFPEGTRTRDGSIQEFKPGVVLLIRRSQAPIIPVAVAGAFESMPPRSWFPRLCPLFLPATNAGLACVIGKPIASDELAQRSSEEVLQLLRDRLLSLREEAERLRRRGPTG